MNPTLQEILDAFATSTDAGQALLAQLDAAALAAMRTEAETAFATVYGDGTGHYSDEDLSAATQLSGAVAAIDAATEAHTAAAAASAEEMARLASAISGTTEGAPAEPAEPAAEGTTPPAQDTATGSTEAGATETTPEPAAAGTPQAIAASGAIVRRVPVDLSRLTSRTPAPTATTQVTERMDNGVFATGSLVAASDVPGMSSGADYTSMDQLTTALVKRLRSMPEPGAKGTPRHMQVGIAFQRKEFPTELVASGNNREDLAMFDYAADQSRLESSEGTGSLIAAGGWCAPSETVYDVWEIETRDGLLSAPEVDLTRGGINFSAGPLFSAIYSAVGFAQTEAQAIANTEKGCVEVPCPAFTDVRMDLLGICINAGILQNKAYPEFVARYIRGAMVAHAHKINASKIARMVTGSDAATFVGQARFTAQDAATGLLEAIEMQAWDTRYKHRAAINLTLEVVLPAWAKGVLRAGISKRTGTYELDVTDAQIDAWFTVRGIAVQWVYDWQDTLATGAAMGAAAPITAWPTSVKFLMYPAGTWVFGTNDVITLDAGIYDTTNININKFNALFTEEGLAAVKRGHDSRVITVPICPSGASAIAVDMDCT